MDPPSLLEKSRTHTTILDPHPESSHTRYATPRHGTPPAIDGLGLLLEAFDSHHGYRADHEPPTELLNGDWTEAADSRERHRIQSRPDIWNDSMKARIQPVEPDLNSAGVAMPDPVPGSLHTSDINQNSQYSNHFVRPATRNPILDWYLSQEKPWDPIPGRAVPWPRVGSSTSPDALKNSPSPDLLGTRTGMNLSQPRSAPVPTNPKPSLHGPGPKIWTGSHFLPRFVRAAELPGEGLCYFYDDGSHCKTVVDGEAVNAHWGVTKAGKPRKRLAIACVTCREKKIKCDPDYPRCVQCEQAGKVCKWKNAPRSDRNQSKETDKPKEVGSTVKQTAEDTWSRQSVEKVVNFNVLMKLQSPTESTAGGVAPQIINKCSKPMENQGERDVTLIEHSSLPGTLSTQLTANGFQGIVSGHTSGHKGDMPLPEHDTNSAAAFGQPPTHSYYAHAAPQAYGSLGYHGQPFPNHRAEPLGYSAAYDHRRGYDDLKDFFEHAKRRSLDPATYAHVGRSLIPLHGALSVDTGGLGTQYRDMTAAPAFPAIGGGYSAHSAKNRYYPPPMPNLRTQDDLEKIDKILEQMQDTITSSETDTIHVPTRHTALPSQGAISFGKDDADVTDGKPRNKWHENVSKRQRTTVLEQISPCSCRQKRVDRQPAEYNTMPTGEDTKEWCFHCTQFATEKELATDAPGRSEQQSYAPFHEGTVADSGYVSACAYRPHPERNSQGDLIHHGDMKQLGGQNRPAADQQTVYTSLALPHGSDYITDLCNDIHLSLKHEFQEYTRDKTRTDLPKCLSDLIKALSIRIGLDRSNPASPYVMHFLHTHYKDIVAQLEALCRHREESPEVSHRRPDEDDGMSVLDKMKLWGQKDNEESTLEPEQGELFEGVGDKEEEDIASNAKMAIHRDYVLSSTAYKWFIASLRKQLSLDWGRNSDDVAEADSCRQIHRSIMSKMASGIISKHRPPEIHHSRFHIKIRPDVFHCLQGGLVANLMTFTSSAPNIIQASTLQDYLHRTWPSRGMSLVRLIQGVCCGEDKIIQSDRLDSNTAITVERLKYSKTADLLVTASGPAYSIAQCGEQLAWIGAAFQSFRSSMANFTCSIESQDENAWLIRCSPGHYLRTTIPESVQPAQRVCDATIIEGFPTQKRPPLFQGLELGLAWMLESIGASWAPVLEKGRIVLKGSQQTLELVKHSQTVLMWHALHSSSVPCSFCDCLTSNEHSKPPFDSRMQTDMLSWNSRHIIANSEHFGLPPVCSALPSTYNNVGVVYAQAQGRSIEKREDLNPTISPADKGSSAIESPGDSLDSDMLSISSADSDHAPSLDPEDPLKSIINVISHHIFNEYKESRGVRSKPQSEHTGNGGPRNKSGNSPVCAIAQSHGSKVRHTGKRAHPDGEDDNWDEGGFRKPPRPTKRPRLSSPRSKLLACPFWKLDSQAHRLCFHRKCNRISDVKLHLARKHKLPATEYCQRCWTAFTSQGHKEEHLRDPLGQRCQYNQAARPVGIDNNMAAALHKKSNSSLSTEDQWFAIWDIAFPDRPRPSSPYIDNSLSEDATQLQEIILNQWPSILASVTEEAERSSEPVNTDRLEQEHLIRATLARLLDDFSAEQETMRVAELASNHQSPGGRTVSSSNRADSAIELESYPLHSHSSSNSGDGASLLTTGAAARQFKPYPPTPIHSSVYGGRERPILPAGQDITNISDDRQEILNPPPPIPSLEQHVMPALATDQIITIPELTNRQTTDNYRAERLFEPDLTVTGSSLPLTTNDWLQAFPENGEFNGNMSWESLENSMAFNLSMFDMEIDNNRPWPGPPGGE